MRVNPLFFPLHFSCQPSRPRPLPSRPKSFPRAIASSPAQPTAPPCSLPLGNTCLRHWRHAPSGTVATGATIAAVVRAQESWPFTVAQPCRRRVPITDVFLRQCSHAAATSSPPLLSCRSTLATCCLLSPLAYKWPPQTSIALPCRSPFSIPPPPSASVKKAQAPFLAAASPSPVSSPPCQLTALPSTQVTATTRSSPRRLGSSSPALLRLSPSSLSTPVYFSCLLDASAHLHLPRVSSECDTCWSPNAASARCRHAATRDHPSPRRRHQWVRNH